ncbi:MAG: hypothetical protein SFV23_14625 [Planctomycetaceae bacterium]|nr:hypothetical protein [Planctomycetaceae bacterium]
MFQPRPPFHRFPAIVCRLMLTLSLWHAPVPWGHTHSTSSPDLAEHVAEHHAEEHSGPLGWHWHLELPDWGQPKSPHDDSHRQTPGCSICFDSAIVSTTTVSVSPPELAPWQFLALRALSVSDASTSRTGTTVFLGTYAPTHSTQQLLCRLSC